MFESFQDFSRTAAAVSRVLQEQDVRQEVLPGSSLTGGVAQPRRLGQEDRSCFPSSRLSLRSCGVQVWAEPPPSGRVGACTWWQVASAALGVPTRQPLHLHTGDPPPTFRNHLWDGRHTYQDGGADLAAALSWSWVRRSLSASCFLSACTWDRCLPRILSERSLRRTSRWASARAWAHATVQAGFEPAPGAGGTYLWRRRLLPPLGRPSLQPGQLHPQAPPLHLG